MPSTLKKGVKARTWVSLARLSRDLSKFLTNYPWQDEFNASLVAKQMVEGLAYIHSRNYIHCDVKPGVRLRFSRTTTGLREADDEWLEHSYLRHGPLERQDLRLWLDEGNGDICSKPFSLPKVV